MGEAPDIKGWVAMIAKELVDRPGAVEVGEFQDDDVTVFELSVDPEELGRVIGRQGRTAQAMRALLEAAGIRHGRYYELEILE